MSIQITAKSPFMDLDFTCDDNRQAITAVKRIKQQHQHYLNHLKSVGAISYEHRYKKQVPGMYGRRVWVTTLRIDRNKVQAYKLTVTIKSGNEHQN